jgi:hypothetical protein
MRFAAWHTRMTTPDTNGSTPRDSYLVKARNGDHAAIRMLEGPTFPESVGHIWDWIHDIRRGLGGGFDGLNALTWSVLESWCHLTGHTPTAEEVSALLSLDLVLRHPESMDATPEAAWT